MAPYQYQPYHNPYVATTAELLEKKGEIAARQAEAIGAIQARAAEQQGNIWGNAIGNIGSIIANVPGQIQRQQFEDQRNKLAAIQLHDAQQRQTGNAAIDSMSKGDQLPANDAGPRQQSYLTSDGLFDIPKMNQTLAQSGMAHLAPELLKSAEGINDAVLKHQQLQKQADDQHTVLVGDMADGVLKLHKVGVPVLDAMDTVAQPALATKRFTPQEYAQIRTQIAQLPPEQQQAVLTNFMDAAAKLDKGENLAEGAVHADRYGRVTAKGGEKPPTEVEVAMRAAGNDPKTAMTLLKPPPNRTAEQDDQRYRQLVADVKLGKSVTPEDAAWAKGYEQQKTLGPEASAAAATNRQTATIAAQVAAETRRETFAENEKGRDTLTNTVDKPYRTALGSASTLRDVVAAAQSGNKVAGSLQSLETTMAAIRAQGLNRINTAEIGVTANAGTMWDRLQGWIGKAAAGEPVPANIQKDMLEFADILEKAAYKTYSEGFDAITKRYKLTDEQKMPTPTRELDSRVRDVLIKNGKASDATAIALFLKQNPGFK